MTSVNYPSYIKMLDNERYILPFIGKEIDKDRVSFVRVSKNTSGGYSAGFGIRG